MKRRNFTKMTGSSTFALLSFFAHSSDNFLEKGLCNSSRIPLGISNHSLRSLKLARKGNAQEFKKPEEGASRKDFDIKLQEIEVQKSFAYLGKQYHAGLKVEVN